MTDQEAEEQVLSENKRLREGYTALFKEIRSRFAKDDEVGYESMSKELREIMLESRKLLNL